VLQNRADGHIFAYLARLGTWDHELLRSFRTCMRYESTHTTRRPVVWGKGKLCARQEQSKKLGKGNSLAAGDEPNLPTFTSVTRHCKDIEKREVANQRQPYPVDTTQVGKVAPILTEVRRLLSVDSALFTWRCEPAMHFGTCRIACRNGRNCYSAARSDYHLCDDSMERKESQCSVYGV